MRISTFLLLLLFPALLSAQSVIFKKTMRFCGTLPAPYEDYRSALTFEDAASIDHKELPKDLSTAKLFYVEMGTEDVTITRAKKINKKLIKGFGKYPFSFQSFTADYLAKGREYFVEQGFKYRVLVYTNLVRVYNENGSVLYQQNFRVVLDDITTGEKYYDPYPNFMAGFYMQRKYVKEFIHAVKKGAA